MSPPGSFVFSFLSENQIELCEIANSWTRQARGSRITEQTPSSSLGEGTIRSMCPEQRTKSARHESGIGLSLLSMNNASLEQDRERGVLTH